MVELGESSLGPKGLHRFSFFTSFALRLGADFHLFAYCVVVCLQYGERSGKDFY